METNLNLSLRSLRCITPTDPSGEDEPYMWAFFIKIDGSTVRQRIGNPLALSASIKLESGGGRPGNLGVDGMKSGAVIPIYRHIGTFVGSLEPITFTITKATGAIKLLIPGQVICFCVLIDEEAVPRDDIEAAFHDVRNYVEQRINDFLNGLDFGPLLAQIITSANPVSTAQALLAQQFTELINQLQVDASRMARQSIVLAIMSRNVFQHLPAAVDRDEPIGNATVIVREDLIINQSLEQSFSLDLRQSQPPLRSAWYVVDGFGNYEIRFLPGDTKVSLLPATEQPLGLGSAIRLSGDRPCAPRGTSVGYQAIAHTQPQRVTVQYPFLSYRYLLNGKELSGTEGDVSIMTTVSIPEFDESKFYFIGGRTVQKAVTVSYAKEPVADAPQFESLVVTNAPADGNFTLVLTIEAVLPNGRAIAVSQQGLSFTGQSIRFDDDFLTKYVRCVAKSMGAKWPKSKLMQPEAWLTPEVKWRQFEDCRFDLNNLQSHQLLDANTAKAVKQRIAEMLQLEFKVDDEVD